MNAGYILGINSVYHESSAAIIGDGEILAAVEEERFNRKKHGKAAIVDNTPILPYNAIDYCLQRAGITLADVKWIGYSFSIDEREKRRDHLVSCGPVLSGGYKTERGEDIFKGFNELVPKLLSIRYGVPEEEVKKRFYYLDHHICHLSSAYYASPFNEAAVLSIDGIGEYETTTMAVGRGNELKVLRDIPYPHSLGFVWELITNFLGFRGNYDECKIMGLASYGKPDRFRKAMESIVKLNDDGTFSVSNLDRSLFHGDYSCLERTFLGVEKRLPYEPLRYGDGNTTHADVAAILQKTTEDIFLGLGNSLYKETGLTNLALAGGVTLNCVANGRLAQESHFNDIWVQPAASDAGTSLGAALWLFHNPPDGKKESRRCRMVSPYLGPEYPDEEIEKILDRYRLSHRKVQDPAKTAAEMLSRGNVIGWFQGRMEFGPRALGTRSILADPRSGAMLDRINHKVKHREPFRPLCPTMIWERWPDWLDTEKTPAGAADFMLATYYILKNKRQEIPAVVNVDGTSRVQLLKEEINLLFYRLISEFEEITGVPIVLNTSFNDREPIVCSPEDAARCFLKTEIDCMFLGNHLVEGPKPWERIYRQRTLRDEMEKFKDAVLQRQ
ncbi:MAG: carbamoyl transferase [Acidobacteria bacterium]|jgi:carbamoyltransferase|nr:carbamoyl transferase [Acidobacteriota bacterium]